MNQSINTDSKNSKEPQQKYRLGTVSIKILGGLKPVLRAPNLALSFCHGSKHKAAWLAWRPSNPTMDHHAKQTNHRQTPRRSKDEDSTETLCNRHPETPGASNNTTGTLEQKKTNSCTLVGLLGREPALDAAHCLPLESLEREGTSRDGQQQIDTPPVNH